MRTSRRYVSLPWIWPRFGVSRGGGERTEAARDQGSGIRDQGATFSSDARAAAAAAAFASHKTGVSAAIDAILDRLTRLHPKIIDLSLDRLSTLLADLGDPQDRIPPVVHIAGTNGKGSTLAYIRAGLESAGLRVHAYTSPHLAYFNERIRLAGALI